jgi:hypothetical protein
VFWIESGSKLAKMDPIQGENDEIFVFEELSVELEASLRGLT